ncbi:organic solvent tolerance protein OstA [Arsenicibacter rosenii]|uniref:Organic solvent tolerance protein OstA n=1 Tax=Arsenicibacter rosenii TaxID=1750698 RepID=A0A1S2VP35_9BACT|nr:organic solvent tolerance protein OstA [Arsenicibacter rosenii]
MLIGLVLLFQVTQAQTVPQQPAKGGLPAPPTPAQTVPDKPTGSPGVIRALSGRDSSAVAGRDTLRQDSLKTDDSFRTTVTYSSRDSTIYSANGQIMELYGDAKVTYGDIALNADYIRLNYTTNEVYAKGRYDSTSRKMVGLPVFKDGADQYDTKEIRYNFRTKKGKIQGVVTQQGEGNIRGKDVKKDADDNMYIRGAIYTTCNLATPHFHINATKLKVVHNKQVIAGPFNLVVNQIPLPIGLPFGFFPFPKKKDNGVSGILMPQYGEEPNGRGYYLRDGGYYWAVNEHLGLQFRGQIYSKGSWGLGTTAAYNKRYYYSGGFDLRYARNRSGDRVDTTQSPRNDFSITWSHSPVPRGRGTFSANVNVTSNSYNSTNSYDVQRYTSNVAGSSVQYNRTFGQYVRSGASFRVNQQFGQINPVTFRKENGKTDISTDFNLGVNQISPFALNGGSGRWYESFRVGFDFRGQATINNTRRTQVDTTGLGFTVIPPDGVILKSRAEYIADSIARAQAIRDGQVVTDPNIFAFSWGNRETIWRNGTIQSSYSIPISLPNVKLFKYINLTPGFSLAGDLYTKKLNYTYIPSQKGVRIDTLKGLFPTYNFAVNASMNTRVYGTFFFKGKRLQAIRHTLAPSIAFSYVPDFSNPSFGMFQELPEELGLPSYKRRISRFRGLGGSAGSATSGQSAFISFGFVNQLEMKVRSRSDSAGSEFKKIPIFDNISMTGSYNMLAAEYKLSNINLSANTQIFKNISFNFSATFDPYSYVEVPTSSTASTSGVRNFVRVNRYAVSEGQGLAHLQSAQIFLSGRLAPPGADKSKRPVPGASDATMRAINTNPDLYVDFNIPWSLNASYSFGVSNYPGAPSAIIQTLNLTGDFSLTPKWKFTFSTGFDFQAKRPSLTTVGATRDLHCWDMSFNWTPFAGSAQRVSNYSFELRARSSILQELKLSRRRSFYDRGGF